MAYFRMRGDKWSFTVDVGVDPKTGKRKQKTVSGFDSEKEARKACAALVTDIDRGAITNTDKRTVSEFMNYFLSEVLANEVSQNTIEGKWILLNKHINPIIGKKILQKLSPDDLQTLYNKLRKELSPGTIGNISRLINQALNMAMEWGYITRNVNKLARKPEYKRTKIEVWTKEEFEHFLLSSVDSHLHPLYMLGLNTGMRPGEIKAAPWDNLSFPKKQLLIDRTALWTQKDSIHIKMSPKNDSSNRIISLPDHLISYLKRLKVSQAPNTHNLIVPGIESDILYSATANKIMRYDCEQAGLPFIKLHGLRHTHATYLLTPPPYGLGISPKAVSERLGHSKTTTTLNTYFSALPNMQESIAEQLDKYAQKPVDKSDNVGKNVVKHAEE